jgi:hypothetical protein
MTALSYGRLIPLQPVGVAGSGKGGGDNHIGRIFTKLGLRDRAATIAFADEHHIIAPS